VFEPGGVAAAALPLRIFLFSYPDRMVIDDRLANSKSAVGRAVIRVDLPDAEAQDRGIQPEAS
jgi:hypothetical protein